MFFRRDQFASDITEKFPIESFLPFNSYKIRQIKCEIAYFKTLLI